MIEKADQTFDFLNVSTTFATLKDDQYYSITHWRVEEHDLGNQIFLSDDSVIEKIQGFKKTKKIQKKNDDPYYIGSELSSDDDNEDMIALPKLPPPIRLRIKIAQATPFDDKTLKVTGVTKDTHIFVQIMIPIDLFSTYPALQPGQEFEFGNIEHNKASNMYYWTENVSSLMSLETIDNKLELDNIRQTIDPDFREQYDRVKSNMNGTELPEVKITAVVAKLLPITTTRSADPRNVQKAILIDQSGKASIRKWQPREQWLRATDVGNVVEFANCNFGRKNLADMEENQAQYDIEFNLPPNHVIDRRPTTKKAQILHRWMNGISNVDAFIKSFPTTLYKKQEEN